MRKHALLKNNTVVEIRDLTEEDYTALAKSYQLIIDIEDMFNRPSVGWILDGNTMRANNNFATLDDAVAEQQKRQREFGQKLSPILVDMMGARNLKLTAEGVTVNVSSLLSSLNSIKALIETGALKTARGVLASVTPVFPAYADIFDYASAQITQFLADNSYE